MLAASIFPAFSWSIVWIFQETGAWLLYLDSWEILSVVAYVLAFALLESCAVFVLVLIPATMLPARLFRVRFAALGSMIVLSLSLWIMLFQLIFDSIIRDWALGEFILWFGLALACTGIASALTCRSTRVENAIRGLAERLTVFLYVYVPLGLLSLIVVIARNVF